MHIRLAPRGLLLGLLLLVAAPVVPAGAADSRGVATQGGWWNRLQGPADGEPDGNAIRPLIPAVPSAPNVPADAIATSGGAGQVDKVAAVGIDLDLADGARVEGLTLRLKESTAGGANVGAEGAGVVACPATTPWGPVENGAWRDRPAVDCTIGSVDGVRTDDGTWTFDLTAIGRLWGDPFAPLPHNGVVLSVEPAATPAPVQVSWLDVDSGQVVLELVATPGAPLPEGSDDPAAPGPLAAPPADPASPPQTGSAAGMAISPAPVGGPAPDPPALASGRPVSAPPDPSAGGTVGSAAPGGPDPDPPAPVAPAPAARTRSAVDFWEQVPTPTALFVPAALGLAVLIGVTLGPAGRPSPAFAREGGLSRALARRSGDGDDEPRPPAARP